MLNYTRIVGAPRKVWHGNRSNIAHREEVWVSADGHASAPPQQLLCVFSCYNGSVWTTWLPLVGFTYNAGWALDTEQTPFHAWRASLSIVSHAADNSCFDGCSWRFILLHEVARSARIGYVLLLRLQDYQMQARSQPSTAPQFQQVDMISMNTNEYFLLGQLSR
jgi:hypothetical protein